MSIIVAAEVHHFGGEVLGLLQIITKGRHYPAFCTPVLRSVLHFSWAHNPVEEQRTQNAADLTLSNLEPVPELLGTENCVWYYDIMVSVPQTPFRLNSAFFAK